MNIQYVDYKAEDIVTKLLPWQQQGLQETATGYGSKLTTTKMLRINNKLYRIYCICYSNSGSCYIIKNGVRLFVRDYPTD
jgi:hypothetical protein